MKISFIRSVLCGLAIMLFNRNIAATFTVINTNDAGAGSFRQAVLDANALAGADVIVFSIGSGPQTITLLSQVLITTNISIDGSSQPGFSGSPIITLAGNSMLQVSGGGASGSVIKFLNLSGVSGSTAIQVNSSSNCLFDNNNLSNVSTGIRFDGTCSTNTISNSNISGCSNFGIHLNNGNNTGATIINNNIQNCANWALYFQYGTPQSINNNTLTGSANGLYLQSATNFTLTAPTQTGPNKNYFGNHTGQVLYISSGNGINVSNWDFSTLAATPLNTRTPLVFTSSSNCLIDNNISTGMNTGLRFDGTCSTNTVSNSNMSGCSNFGIHMNNGNNTGATIINNNIQNCANWALYYQYGNPQSINNNTLTGSANGLYLQSATNFTLTAPTQTGPNKNYFGNHTGQVLYISSGNGINVSNWDFSTLAATPLNTRTPLVFTSSSNCLIDNNISTGMSTGIRFDGTCSTNTVSNSNMSGCSNFGIHMNNGNNTGATIINNNIQNCANWALYYQYGNPQSINNNTLTGSANGLYLQSATNFTLTAPTQTGPNKNYFGNHTGQVLYISSGNGINVSNWDFSTLAATPLNTRTPLVFTSSSNCLIDNNISTGMSTALRFDGTCSTNTVSNSNMSGCSNFGIHMNNGNNTGATIINNNIQNCANWALYYQYGNPQSINNNTLTGSANGLYLQSATNFTLTAPTQTGPNKNYFGNHTGQVLYISSGNGINVSNWDFSTLAATPLNTRTPLVFTSSSNCLIDNNISTGMNTGLRFDGTCSTNTVSNSNMSGCSNFGIHMNNGNNTGATIINNNIQNCANWALYYQYGNPQSINNNTLTGSANGLYLQSATNFTLTAPTQTGPNKNYFGNHTGQVLYISSGNGINVSNWDFSTLAATPLNTRTPLVFTSSSNCLIDNNISTGMNTGLRFDGTCSTNTVSNSNMSGCSNFGIHMNNGNNTGATIINNNLQNCANWALYFQYGTPQSINNNTLTGSTNGLYLQSASTFALGSNIFGGQTGTSIQLQACTAVNLSNVTTNGTGGHGILINNCNSCVVDGNISCGRQFGIRLQGPCNGNNILNSSIGSAQNAIYIDNTSVNNTAINTATFSANTTNIFNGGLNTTITGTVSGNMGPVISVNNGTICSGNSFTMVPTGALSYTYQGGSAVVSPTASATYTVIGTGSNGCASAISATSNVVVNTTPTVSVNNGSICTGSTFTIIPGGAASYTIQGGSAIVSPNSNSTYTVIGESSAGCMSTNTATSNVIVNATPTVSANNGTICSGNSFTIAPTGAASYTIQGGNAIVSPGASASYTVIGESSAGCVSANTATSNVVVNTTPTIAVNNGTVCAGNSFTIIPTGAASYTIEGGNAVVTPTASSTYTVIGESTEGCLSSNTASSTVQFNTLPSVSAMTSNSVICSQPVQQSATLTASGASTYTWSNSMNGTSITVSPSVTTVYTVTGTDGNGCENTSMITQSVTVCTGIVAINNGLNISVYPNPNNGLFTIEIGSLTSDAQLTVINVIGAVVLTETISQEKTQINIENLSNGIYFVQVQQNNSTQIIKLIKN